MNTGDRVIITKPDTPWPGGTLLYVRTPDKIRHGNKRLTHFVKFDEKPGMDYYGAWFDPEDLTVVTEP